ncbi:hypothetical protein AAC387_Pa08g0759 [Persea americana]
MALKSIVRDGIRSLSRRRFDFCSSATDVRFDSVETLPSGDGYDGEESHWAELPPEILWDVVRRLEASESAWQGRRNVVACAAVCRAWRRVCKEVAGVPEISAKLTFSASLKQPGPRTTPIQCYIKRNKASSTYHLYLGLNTDSGKFLLAAQKIGHPTTSEYIISLDTKDISRKSIGYMGKLRSNFLGTKFAIYDSQPPYCGAVTSTGRSSCRFYSRKVSPKVPFGSYDIAHVAYELNMLGTCGPRGPRRMHCTMHSIPSSALEPKGSVPYFSDLPPSLEDSFSGISFSRSLDHIAGDLKSTDSSRFSESNRFTKVSVDVSGKEGPLILKNNTPRWHEPLQFWCLNFHGRVTVASVKNFQLIAASGGPTDKAGAGTSQAGSSEHDKIILQFGRIGKDLFTMDYRYPLSAFQAFGICLSSFDSKLPCE